jgi:hypothetical protein
MTRSDPGLNMVREKYRPVGSGNGRFLLHAGMATAFALLWGIGWYLGNDPVPQPAPEVKQVAALRGDEPAPLSAAATAPGGDIVTAAGRAATQGVVHAETQQAPIAAVPPGSGLARTKRIATAPVAAPYIAPQPTLTDAATATVPAPSSVADSPVSATTLKEYRSAVDECRDAIRDVIRLGNRQRPGPRASAGEQTGYRLRQQNAEAAKSYRAYLDTLARSMRGTKSETLARQSLERARQTLGYVNTMLADSQNSLR